MCQSVIFHFVYTTLLKIAEAYRKSKTYTLINYLGETLKKFSHSSVICGLISSNEKASGFWEQSFFYKIVQKVLNILLLPVRKLYLLCRTAFENSISGRVVSKVFNNFIVSICLFIFIFIVTPHNKWHNQYGIIMVVIITLLHVLKTASIGDCKLDIRKLDFTLWAFILTAFTASVTSITPVSSIKTFILIVAYLLFVFIMVNSVNTEEELSLILYSLIGAVSIASVIGLLQYFNHVPVDPLLVDVEMGKGVGRIFSTMGNANVYAEMLVLTLPFYGAVFFNAKSKKSKILTALLALLPVSNLALTYSRAGFIAIIGAVVVYVFLKNWRWMPALILLGVITLPFLPASIIDRMQTIGKDSSSLYRVDIWKGGGRILKDYWVTGIGTGSEPFVRLFRNYSMASVPAHSHMFPLQLWIEYGIVGVIFFIWFILRIIKKGVTLISRGGNKYLENIVIACIASLTGIFIIGIVEYIWFYPRMANMFWMVIGIFLTALNLARSKKVPKQDIKAVSAL
jgi:putative inorganic carbon (HCO3(-)) transporter